MLASIVAALLFFTASVAQDRFEPYPICDECRDPDLMIAPGIGFDLTHSYGVSAIRFHNGSVVVVEEAIGDDGYYQLMERCSLSASRPREPKTPWERIKYGLERARRALNKQRGLPATKSVGIIASMISQLRRGVESKLGEPITSVVVASPSLPGLTDEDLEDAMEYAGLQQLRAYNFFVDVSENDAAYAAAGHGLCKNPEEIQACEDEDLEMPEKYVISISFSNALLSLSLNTWSSVSYGSEFWNEYCYELGLHAMDQWNSPVEYWWAVSGLICDFVRMSLPVDLVQLLGEEATNKDFQEALREALSGLEFANVTISQTDPTVNRLERLEPLGLAARGAADLAKRFQVMTWGCKEPASCESAKEKQDMVFEL